MKKRPPRKAAEEVTTAGPLQPPSPGAAHSQFDRRTNVLSEREAQIASDPARRWKLGSRIAVGGMGEVSEAFDQLLHREVAVKVLHPVSESSLSAPQQFLEEARITAGLDHPGIVPVHDLLVRSDGLNLVMKRVRGQTLTEVFEKIHALPLRQEDVRRVCRILVRACEAVGFAHSHGVIHCDLKPDNLMVGEHGEVYIMDWGVAHVQAGSPHGASLRPEKKRRTSSKNRIKGGTVAFMAPEQADSKHGTINERTDVHGLGGILYSFLCGRAPYAGGNLASVIDRPREGVGPSIDANCVWPDAPPGLIAIATRALAPAPEDRHPSVAAFRADLEQFLDGGGWFASRDFSPGETIVEEGSAGDSAYILVSGRCGVYKQRADRCILLRRLAPGDVFGETAVVAQEPVSATVVAETAVTVKIVTKESLERELARNPWMAAFTLTLAARFLELDREQSPNEDR